MTTSEYWFVIGSLLVLIAIVGYFAYLTYRISVLAAQLNESQFQVEKESNNAKVSTLSDADLNDELNFELSGPSSGSSTKS